MARAKKKPVKTRKPLKALKALKALKTKLSTRGNPQKKTAPRASSARAASTNRVSGPARSRRFGLSLNVNFGTPGHACGWNCVYCPWRSEESKKTRTAQVPPSAEELLSDLGKKLKTATAVETVILGGSTEPTIHPEFSKVVEGVLKLRKDLQGDWALVCLSNGAGLAQSAVRAACNQVDQLWVKLDCSEDVLFQKTNKPGPKSEKSVAPALAHLKQLRDVRLQTTLWRFPDKSGFQNWSAENLAGLLEIYRKIEPAAIHLVTVKRKKVFEGVQPVSFDELEAFALRVAELGIPVEVFA